MVAYPGRAGPLFPLGRTVATPGALKALTNDAILAALTRHVRGDWGELDPEDAAANDRALLTGGRILSVYFSVQREKFYIITEADRSVTTVLLPHEY